MALLEVRNLTKRFGGLVALRDLNFRVQEGEIVGLVGPNGSGKSTLFSVIGGAQHPNAGQVIFDGQDITDWPPHKICHAGIARTFQVVQPLLQLSVLTNVMVGACFGQEPALDLNAGRRESERVLERIGLSEKAGLPARALSLGQLKLLELARALATRPRLLLLDEVGAGLSPGYGVRLRALLRELQDEGITIVGIEHALHAVSKVSDRIVVLYRGQVLLEGEPSEVVEDPRVTEAYLGE